ncbi:MAG: AlpA family phage regulatory protein [Candidatus Sedimenticola sp. 20ELBAFRAG]
MKDLANLPDEALIRLPEVLTLIPISRSAWWAGIGANRYPKPVKLSPRVSAWRLGDIRCLIARA